MTGAAPAPPPVQGDAQSLLGSLPPSSHLRALVQTALSANGGSAARPCTGRWARFAMAACASASAGTSDAAVPLGVAAELPAAAYRLLDDLADGHPSAVSRLARPAVACNATTALLALAQRALLAVPAPAASLVAEAWLRVCAAQHDDLTASADLADPLGAALRMAEAKTATIVAALMEAGALLGGADPELAALYRRFGHALGLAGQYANDLLGLRPDPGGSTDVSRGHLTAPVACGLGSAAPALRACLRARCVGAAVPETLHAQALAELEACGAPSFAWLLMRGAQREALRRLREIERLRPVAGTLDRLVPRTLLESRAAPCPPPVAG